MATTEPRGSIPDLIRLLPQAGTGLVVALVGVAAAMEAAMDPAGIALLEDQSVQDLMEVAAGKPLAFRSATPGGGAVAVLRLASLFVQAIGAAVLVARFSILPAVVPLATTLVIRRRMHRANRAQATSLIPTP